MKRIVLIGMMILGMVVMAEKLNTDGKDHLKELLGKWGEPQPVYLIAKNSKLYYIDEEEVENPVTKLNTYTYVINRVESGDKSCFAYDIKHKKFAFLKCGTNEVEQYMPKKYNTFGG